MTEHEALSHAADRQGLTAVAFVEIVNALVGDFDVTEVLTGLAAHSVQLVDASAAGILLADQSGNLSVAAASSDQAQLIEPCRCGDDLDHPGPGSPRRRDREGSLQRALDRRIVIEQAKGMIAERSNTDMFDAFNMLRRYTLGNGLKLHDVATRIVFGQLGVDALTATPRLPPPPADTPPRHLRLSVESNV